MASRLAKDRLIAGSQRLFLLLDRFGLHVLPKHYYTSIPDHLWLSENRDAWTRRAPLRGVCWDLQRQLDWLTRVCSPYYQEVAGLRHYHRVTALEVGPGFGPIESQVLHGFIRACTPRRVIEVGSGVSTACMLYAAELNVKEGRPGTHVTCIEPFPKKHFSDLEGVAHVQELCQTVPASLFAELEAGDLLFVDSSHAVKCGSDVLRIWLDIVPGLPPGVFIHAHDIYLPYLFGPDVLSNYFDWQETSLLLALLTNNPRLMVLASLAALHYDRSAELASLLTDYVPEVNAGGLRASTTTSGHFPSSIWLQTA